MRTRVERLLKLVNVLQAGAACSVAELTRQVGVSRRTLFRDLNMLKCSGLPLVFNEARRQYTLTRNQLLPAVNLNLSEALSLMMMARKGVSRSVLPDGRAVTAAMAKIRGNLPAPIQHFCEEALGSVDYLPGKVTDAAGAASIFERMWRAAQARDVVEITYDSFFEGKEIRLELEPYKVVFISRGWYVVGLSRAHGEVRTFKLDRVVRMDRREERFADPRFDLAEYFGNAWQMIRGRQRYRVHIRFSARVARNVEEVCWHKTQLCEWLDDGSLCFEVEVDGLEEISWWVLGYGKEATVETPPELREIIAGHVKAMAAEYKSSEL